MPLFLREVSFLVCNVPNTQVVIPIVDRSKKQWRREVDKRMEVFVERRGGFREGEVRGCCLFQRDP